MTETQIRQLAESLGLMVEKRIDTGRETRHFATFEISGPMPLVRTFFTTARKEVDRHWLPFILWRVVDNVNHKNHGGFYVEIRSVWCEVKP